MRIKSAISAAVSGLAGAFPLAAQEAPKFSLPIACEPHKTCFIQSYADHDASPEFHDYACGTATYDGHRGTDFRVLSAATAAKGVPVLASAEGVIKGMRDGMDDFLIPDNAYGLVANRECGNGVVIDHGGGFETQYCHMKKGSVLVKKGDAVARGQRLGDVGYSGLAEFAHVHFELRKDGKVLDPFTGHAQSDACQVAPATTGSLWTPDVLASFPRAETEFLDAMFAASVPTGPQMEADNQLLAPDGQSSELYYVARIANVRRGDVVHVSLTGPAGFKYDRRQDPLPVNRGRHIAYGVAKTGQGGQLPVGEFVGKIELLRDGKVVGEKSGAIKISR
jgi:murein DD-endopeptidase MepM/ murein hydrolase activator NlpD